MRGPLQRPPRPRRLGLTAGAWLLCAANLLFEAEFWPHTPGMKQALWQALWLLTLGLLPQLAWAGWCWLEAWPMPWWLELVVRPVYMCGVAILGLLWLVLLAWV